MEILIIILIGAIILIYLKLRKIQNHLTVLSFWEKITSNLLLKKGLTTPSELDVAINESIGNMPEEDGNRIIQSAKNIGITIPNYMNEEELKIYVEKQEQTRRSREISFSDRILMGEFES